MAFKQRFTLYREILSIYIRLPQLINGLNLRQYLRVEVVQYINLQALIQLNLNLYLITSQD